MILENGGAGPAVGTLMRQILDHIMLGDNNTDLPAENQRLPQRRTINHDG